jgi:MFS family permease
MSAPTMDAPNTDTSTADEVRGRDLIPAQAPPAETPSPERERGAFRTTFRSLSTRNYRLFAAGQVVSNTGTWMQRIAQDWLVLTLTHSGTALGVVTALQFLPILLLSMWGGTLADRYRKRTMLMITQTVMGVLALVLAGLTISGAITVWQIYLFALAMGTVAAIDTPARQAFVVEMVGPDQLQNAVSLNSANFNLARVLGPTVAGLMIGLFAVERVGCGWVFAVNAISYAAVVAGLGAIRVRELKPSKRIQRARGQQLEGLRYLRSRPDLLAVLYTVAVFGTFGLNFPVLTPLFTTTVFHSGASSYGLVSAAMALGSLAGALLAARRGTARVRVVIAGTAVFGAFEALAAAMPSFLLFGVVLVIVGLFSLTVATTANAVMQTTVEPELRGRVMGVYLLVFMGGTPVGSPLVGWLSGVIGVRWTLAATGLLCVLGAVVAAYAFLRRTDRRIALGLTRLPRVAEVPRAA